MPMINHSNSSPTMRPGSNSVSAHPLMMTTSTSSNLPTSHSVHTVGSTALVQQTHPQIRAVYHNDYYKVANATELTPAEARGLPTIYDSNFVRTFKSNAVEYCQKPRGKIAPLKKQHDTRQKDGDSTEDSSDRNTGTSSALPNISICPKGCKCICNGKCRCHKNNGQSSHPPRTTAKPPRRKTSRERKQAPEVAVRRTSISAKHKAGEKPRSSHQSVVERERSITAQKEKSQRIEKRAEGEKSSEKPSKKKRRSSRTKNRLSNGQNFSRTKSASMESAILRKYNSADCSFSEYDDIKIVRIHHFHCPDSSHRHQDFQDAVRGSMHGQLQEGNSFEGCSRLEEDDKSDEFYYRFSKISCNSRKKMRGEEPTRILKPSKRVVGPPLMPQERSRSAQHPHRRRPGGRQLDAFSMSSSSMGSTRTSQSSLPSPPVHPYNAFRGGKGKMASGPTAQASLSRSIKRKCCS